MIYFGVWLSLVECLVRDQEAAGSNPVTPTKKSRSSERDFFIQADRLGISPRFSVYIINSQSELYLITPLGVHKKSVGLMIYKTSF